MESFATRVYDSTCLCKRNAENTVESRGCYGVSGVSGRVWDNSSNKCLYHVKLTKLVGIKHKEN